MPSQFVLETSWRRAYSVLRCVFPGFLITGLASGRNIVLWTLPVLAVLCLADTVQRKPTGRGITTIAFLFMIVLHFSPFDFCVRPDMSLGVGAVPIVYEENSYSERRRRLNAGQRVNHDFVVYLHSPLLPPAQWAIVFRVPLTWLE